MKRKIIILGSTGSIGENAIRVAHSLNDEIEVVGVAAGQRVDRLTEQARLLNCRYAGIGSPELFSQLSESLPATCQPLSGINGMVEMASAPEVDIVLCAVVGTAGLKPVLAAINAGKTIALASKEIMVMAGDIVTRAAAENNVDILPVDSEHAAIYQGLQGRKMEEVERIILTASGGPFRQTPLQELTHATYDKALAHPTWDMGPKITIDSATMMNKALELIEARWLFDTEPENIDVLIHPQSIIHSMVEFIDGSLIALLGQPDMRQPIQYALTHPERRAGELPKCDLAKVGCLTFEDLDNTKFPAIELARSALQQGGTMPAVFNAANEVAVDFFRREKIGFLQIPETVRQIMAEHKVCDHPTLETILEADEWARNQLVKP
ncbi:MAG: 1-deoxy-D-xylulose-5-phosphate reductoisomerase [Verrucomicrobiota bacterium]